MALYYHLKGMNLVEAYDELAKRLNKYFKSELFSIYFEGSEGASKMASIMEKVETSPFKELLGNKVKVIENYFKLERKDLVSNKVSSIENLPKGDLVKFYFEDGTNIAIRPSGTEPKCKFYIEVVSKDRESSKGLCEKYFEELKKILL